MNIIDLSHPLDENMPVYPGTEQPVFAEGCTLEADGFREKKITFYSHTGTHMDAPSHLLPDGRCLDDFPLGYFTGPACVLNAAGGEGSVITEQTVLSLESTLRQAEYLLVQTGWSRFWNSSGYFGRFPVLTLEAARFIASLGLKGIGFDCISADAMDAPALPNHKILLGAGMVIIENLQGLEQLPRSGFSFSAFPLPISGADGSPVRAAAIL